MKSNKNKPNFNSKTLSDAFDAVSDIFEHHQEDINSVSSDIKTIEEYIKSKNVQVAFQDTFAPRNSGYQYTMKWDKVNHESKDFRLICDVATYDGDFWTSQGEKPLIEHSLSVRMAVYPYLSSFFQSLAQQIKIFNRKPPEPDFDFSDFGPEPNSDQSKDIPF